SNMRLLIWILLFLAPVSAAIAENDQKKHQLLNQSIHAVSILNQTSTALLATSDLLTNSPDMDPGVIEATLARYANQVDGIRSILVLNDRGELLYDTYNKVASKGTPLKLNLGDREYFKGAFNQHDMTLYAPVKGRTSGSIFLPISQAVMTNELVKYVAVAIISPNRLIHPSVIQTEYSLVTIFNKQGELLAKFPDGTDIPENFYGSLETEKNLTKARRVPFNQNVADSVWTENEKYEITVVYSVIQPTN
ncbi:MAG: hypothetical protein MI743_15835, partial [Sneathiellales bacterium]|nr:hypothetical protein [Sneathiellales bacterium]